MPMQTASSSAPAVQAAALLAGDPFRVAGLRRDVTVEAHRGLEHHQRAPGSSVLAKRLVEQPCAVRDVAVDHLHFDALVAQDSRPRRTPSRSGRPRRPPRGRCRPSRSHPCTEVSGPDGSTARESRTSSPRSGRSRGQRSHLRVIAAVRGVDGPRPAPGRRGRSRPHQRVGAGMPRPSSASSIALRMCRVSRSVVKKLRCADSTRRPRPTTMRRKRNGIEVQEPCPAPPGPQAVDPHRGPRSLVCARIVVEAPVEVEHDGPVALPVGVDHLGEVWWRASSR